MASSDSHIDKPQHGHPNRAEVPDVNINTHLVVSTDEFHSEEEVHSRSRRDSDQVALCPQGTFLKDLYYCVARCPSGYYGDTTVNMCSKCDRECNTCLDGDTSNRCSSCHSPLYLKGTENFSPTLQLG